MRRPGRLLVFLVLGVLALLAGQLLSDWSNRKANAEYQRAGCARGLFDRADAIEADHDEATFRRDAATARQASGEVEVAGEYRASARRAERRARRRAGRLLGASWRTLGHVDAHGRPTARAVKLAERTCAHAVPAPSLLP